MHEIKRFENGFEYLEVTNSVMSAKIALQGAHIFEFEQKEREPILWLSPVSEFERGKAIRGGVPICWPRFGNLDKSMPAHGFSRTSLFKLIEVIEKNDVTTEVRMRLTDDAKTREIWDYKFELDVVFTLGETLKIELITKNRDIKEFMITQALHSYFCVSDIADVRVEGLEQKEFLDTLRDIKSKENVAITIDAEIDRVYQKVDRDITLCDAKRCIVLKAKGSASAIIWNPWIEKGSRMSGMKSDAYREFLCIETANAFDDARVVRAKESHSLSVEIVT